MTSWRSDVTAYLRQQAELFGSDFYLEETRVTQLQPCLTLDQLRAQVAVCRRCALADLRTQTVFGCGDPASSLLFVGEAPGEQEDRQGVPFVGRAGQLLNNLLAEAGIRRSAVYIANVLKCRPPNNRDPLPEEVERCEPYLKQQIALLAPQLIVCLGRIAARTLLKIEATLGAMREQTFRYEGCELVVTYHPSALLRNPGLQPAARQDFARIKSFITPTDGASRGQ